jgi:hypothetical protein
MDPVQREEVEEKAGSLVDAALGDEAMKEVNTSKADTKQMPVQAMEVPIDVVDISDSMKDDESSDDAAL